MEFRCQIPSNFRWLREAERRVVKRSHLEEDAVGDSVSCQDKGVSVPGRRGGLLESSRAEAGRAESTWNILLGTSFPLSTNMICGFGFESDSLGLRAPLTGESTVIGVVTSCLKSGWGGRVSSLEKAAGGKENQAERMRLNGEPARLPHQSTIRLCLPRLCFFSPRHWGKAVLPSNLEAAKLKEKN